MTDADPIDGRADDDPAARDLAAPLIAYVALVGHPAGPRDEGVVAYVGGSWLTVGDLRRAAEVIRDLRDQVEGLNADKAWLQYQCDIALGLLGRVSGRMSPADFLRAGRALQDIPESYWIDEGRKAAGLPPEPAGGERERGQGAWARVRERRTRR